jgi:hypothetical protein
VTKNGGDQEVILKTENVKRCVDIAENGDLIYNANRTGWKLRAVISAPRHQLIFAPHLPLNPKKYEIMAVMGA